MEKYVIKRNGAYVPLEIYKIQDAIKKGFQSVSYPLDDRVFEHVQKDLADKDGRWRTFKTPLNGNYIGSVILRS